MSILRAFREYLSEPAVWGMTLLVAILISLLFVGVRQSEQADKVKTLLYREGYLPVYTTPYKPFTSPGCAKVCLVKTYRAEGSQAVPVTLQVCVDGEYRLLSE